MMGFITRFHKLDLAENRLFIGHCQPAHKQNARPAGTSPSLDRGFGHVDRLPQIADANYSRH